MSIVSSVDSKCSKFYYDYLIQEKNPGTLGQNIEASVIKAMVEYQNHSGVAPTDIIIMRDGLSDQQAEVVMRT